MENGHFEHFPLPNFNFFPCHCCFQTAEIRHAKSPTPKSARFQLVTDCEWLLLLYLQGCLINLINQPAFAQRCGDAKPSCRCCSKDAALASISNRYLNGTAKKGIAERQPGREQPRVPLQKTLDQRGQKQILAKSEQITAPAVTPASPGKYGEQGPGPPLDLGQNWRSNSFSQVSPPL